MISFDEGILRTIQDFRGSIIGKGEEISFTDAVNAILSVGLGHIKGSEQLKKVMKKRRVAGGYYRWHFGGS